MKKQLLIYYLCSTALYLFLAAIEIFVLRPLVDFAGFGYRSHLLVYGILLLVINPVLCYLLMQRLPEKKK